MSSRSVIWVRDALVITLSIYVVFSIAMAPWNNLKPEETLSTTCETGCAPVINYPDDGYYHYKDSIVFEWNPVSVEYRFIVLNGTGQIFHDETLTGNTSTTNRLPAGDYTSSVYYKGMIGSLLGDNESLEVKLTVAYDGSVYDLAFEEFWSEAYDFEWEGNPKAVEYEFGSVHDLYENYGDVLEMEGSDCDGCTGNLDTMDADTFFDITNQTEFENWDAFESYYFQFMDDNENGVYDSGEIYAVFSEGYEGLLLSEGHSLASSSKITVVWAPAEITYGIEIREHKATEILIIHQTEGLVQTSYEFQDFDNGKTYSWSVYAVAIVIDEKDESMVFVSESSNARELNIDTTKFLAYELFNNWEVPFILLGILMVVALQAGVFLAREETND